MTSYRKVATTPHRSGRHRSGSKSGAKSGALGRLRRPIFGLVLAMLALPALTGCLSAFDGGWANSQDVGLAMDKDGKLSVVFHTCGSLWNVQFVPHRDYRSGKTIATVQPTGRISGKVSYPVGELAEGYFVTSGSVEKVQLPFSVVTQDNEYTDNASFDHAPKPGNMILYPHYDRPNEAKEIPIGDYENYIVPCDD